LVVLTSRFHWPRYCSLVVSISAESMRGNHYLVEETCLSGEGAEASAARLAILAEGLRLRSELPRPAREMRERRAP
jgi:hypothetical protein